MCWLLLFGFFFTVLLNEEFPKVQRKVREIEFSAGKVYYVLKKIKSGNKKSKIGFGKREKMKYSNNYFK